MTSTTDMAGHPDVTEISDLAEGLLPPSRTADVRRHLDACELCAEVHASLEEIRGLLGTLPGPPRMPDDVAHRIDAALAAEALLDATAPGPAEPADTAHEAVSAAAVGDRAHVSRETSAPDRPSGRPRTAGTGPGRKERTRRGRRKVAVLSTVLGAAAVGLGTVLVTSLTGGGSGTAKAPQTTTADTFARGTLQRQVTDLLAQNAETGGSRAPRSLGIESDTGGPRVYRQLTVPECVQKGIGRKDAALATEEGTYQGTDALLIVLPETGNSGRVTAYIVDATCVKDPSSADSAKVLLKNSYPRP
ncbi:anti-sigma factor family protein [Streptomyces griseosporeus]|uniref:anti-sigma factor family protein n=1 Tax=Streptomyces griseosporeus TaxID=1910 RepID=UPI0037B2E315